MGWKDRYREASFRGVAFFVEGAEATFGRRLSEHEFPQVDDPFIEDMGRKKRSFTVDGYLLGDDHLDQCDAMIIASEKPGPGKLIHPYRGTMTVNCHELTIRDTDNDARITRIQFKFVQTGDNAFQTPVVDTQKKVQLTALQVLQNQKTVFQKAFGYATIPYAQAQQVLATVRSSLDAIQKARGVIGQGAAFAQALSTLSSSVGTVVLDAGLLCQDVFDLVTLGLLDTDEDGVPDFKQAFIGISKLFDFDPEANADSTTNQAFISMIQQSAAVTAALVSSQIAYESTEEALSFRDTVLEKLDAVSNETLDDTLFIAYQDLRSVVHDDINSRAANLSHIIAFTPAQTLPALVISHMLYGSIDQEQDIIARNHIQHPGFVIGGQSIEVLLDA